MILLALLFLKLAFASDSQPAVFDGDLYVLLLNVGQFALDEVFFIVLGDVHQRCPFRSRDRFLLVVPHARRKAAKEVRETVLQFFHFLEWTPTCNRVHK